MNTIPSPFTFSGGIHPSYNKELSAGAPIRELPLPARLVVPLSQHLGSSKGLLHRYLLVQQHAEKEGVGICREQGVRARVASEVHRRHIGSLGDAAKVSFPPPGGQR